MRTEATNDIVENVEKENGKLFINEQFDWHTRSLIDAAIAVESELTGISVNKFQEELQLQHLVIKSKLANLDKSDKDKLMYLLDILYQQQDFKGDWQAFFQVKNALISKVLSRRKGIPISMGVLLLDLLDLCGFDAQGICFPSGFLIRINLENEQLYLDPFTGELPTWQQLELKVRGQLGNHARLSIDMLQPDDNKTIIKRLINVIKAAYIQADKLHKGLLCCDILLRIDPNDAYEIRDRGFLFQQLDCFKLASSDFQFFIDQFPEDPIVSLLKQQIKQMSLETDSQVIH